MKNILIIFSIFILTSFCQSNQKKLTADINFPKEPHNRTTDWEKENLKGNVHSYVEIGKPEKLVVDEISGASKEKFVFNSEGNLTERDFYSYRSQAYIRQWTYKYDKQGNQLEFRECTDDGFHEKCILSKYVYKEEGSQKEIKQYEIREFFPEANDGDYVRKKWIYTYNKKGHLTKAEEYRGEKELNTVTNYICDDKGNLIKKLIGKSITSYKYNKRGNLIEWKYQAGYDKDLDKIITYSYDEKDNITAEEYRRYSDRKVYTKYSYEYEYDEKDNWIKCKKYKNETLVNILSRTYEYFKK